MVTDVKKRRVLAILRDDCIATLKQFLSKILEDKGKEVCIDMKEALWKVVQALFPRAKAWEISNEVYRRVQRQRAG